SENTARARMVAGRAHPEGGKVFGASRMRIGSSTAQRAPGPDGANTPTARTVQDARWDHVPDSFGNRRRRRGGRRLLEIWGALVDRAPRMASFGNQTPAAGTVEVPRASLAAEGSLGILALGALGVVYGDIGTSPLYALSQCVDFVAGKGVPVRAEEILGVLSLIFWALTLVVSVKYLSVIMRFDNQGEGGILALLALLRSGSPASRPSDPGSTAPASEATGLSNGAGLAALGIFGAALLYGDGMITPAISVLSAVEGLGVATDAFRPFVVPITVALLAGLFSVQRFGTAGVARFFGPTMLLWFVTIAALGLARIVAQEPDHASVLQAIDPRWAVRFLAGHRLPGFLILGAVVLTITGAEALYADLGHFGVRPIRAAWSAVVFPALVLNYFGQGALIIERGGMVHQPFFEL